MAVTLRLTRCGAKKKPFYRIVAAEKIFRRDGRFLEVLGTYNPRVTPPAVVMKTERVKYWVTVGAQLSQLVRDLIRKNIPGLVEEREKAQLDKKRAARKKRKERSEGKDKAKKSTKKKS